MHTLALILSAGAFRLASRLLDSAIHHKRKLNEHEFIEEHERLHELFAAKLITAPAGWIEAEPFHEFDPVHPDYVDHYSEK